MANSFISVEEPATPTKKLDSESLTVGANTVERERIQITGIAATDIAPVTLADGLSVKVTNTVAIAEPVTVDATNLDIRDLTFAGDKVDVSGSTGVGVTGAFFQATQPISAVALPLPTGAATAALQTQPGVDIGDVTVNNAAGASAVNVQDGGNSITVDGAVTVSGTATVSATDLDIRDLLFASDKVDVSGSSVTVSATNLDIRDLTFAADKVDATGSAVTVTAMPANTTATGTITAAAQTVSITVPAGASSIGLQVAGTWTGQIEFEGTVGNGYVSVYASNNSGNSTNATAGNGIFILPAAGFSIIRVRASAWTSGTADIDFNASIGSAGGVITQALPAGTNNIGDVDIASITAGDTVIGRVKITDGTDVADVLDLASSNPLTVAVVDGTGAQITSFGGGTQYTEDVAAAADPVGTAQILVRQDTPATLVTTDGDNVARRGTNYGAAYSQIVTSAGAFVDTFGGGTQYTEGDVDATITGTAFLWEDASDTLRAVSAAKPLPITLPKAATATLTNVASTTTSTTLKAANTARLGLTIFNDSTRILYVKFGATASSTSFTVKMLAGSYYEVPFDYTGIVDGIWAAVNGAARITELTL